MKYYQELTLLPDPEINTYFIWQKLYTQLHIALADIKNQQGIDTIGVSFPNYCYIDKNDSKDGREFAKLGNKLRVFAHSEEDLKALNLNKWLERLTDYIHIKGIKAVPDEVGYVVVSRYRYKNLQKQAQQFAAFKQISLEDAVKHCQRYKQASRKKYPFINLKSIDNNENFKLSIKQVTTENVVIGSFNTYGLNTDGHTVSVPHW